MPERTWRMSSWPLPAGGRARSRPTLRLRYFLVGGFLAMPRLLARPVGNRFDLDPALLGDAPRGGEALQAVDRRPHHVVRVSGPEALREDVAHAGALQHRAHGPARDDARPGRGRLEEHPTSAVVSHGLVPQRA